MPQKVGMPVPETAQKVKEFQEGGSVFDSPLKAIARKLALLIPTGVDPTDVLNPLAAPAALGVTTFLKRRRAPGLAGLFGRTVAEPVPDVAARQASTERAMKQLVEVLQQHETPADIIEEIVTFAQRFPRVLAHVNEVKSTRNFGAPRAGASIKVDGGRRPGRATLNISPDLGKAYQGGYEPNLKDVLRQLQGPGAEEIPINNSIAHELTHVAQSIGLKDKFGSAYKAANDSLGYEFNPFEMSARHVAGRHFPLPTSVEPFMGLPDKPASTASSIAGLVALLKERSGK